MCFKSYMYVVVYLQCEAGTPTPTTSTATPSTGASTRTDISSIQGSRRSLDFQGTEDTPPSKRPRRCDTIPSICFGRGATAESVGGSEVEEAGGSVM